ncbi:MAG: right-handed parallel beta-helix repeat-containing protein, partial [Candidatus Nitrosopolaris sp.]
CKKISKHGQRNDAKSIVVQYIHCKKIDCKRYHIVGSQVMQHCIENNKVHTNAGEGLDFGRNMYNSIARNNIVYNEPKGILVSQSHNNMIYNNTISTSGDGINVRYWSTRNKIYDNTIMNSLRCFTCQQGFFRKYILV